MLTPEFQNKDTKSIKLLVMDVDGTLTDSAMYYSANGEELKRFSTRDGMGITLLRRNNIETAIITSEESQIAVSRAKKLNIDHVMLGCKNKTEALNELALKLNLNSNEIAYIGDDINDEHVMNICGFSACPSDAVQAILNTADYVCENKGGYGAVREFCELILTSQNKSITLSENW
jgi:YrbI family 3-deoxy-D-manno-octulosonate 8-phosphate phosphatase